MEAILPAVRREGVARMVVNGACEADWPDVLALAERHPEIIPSFGYHPWYVRECSETWQERLLFFLDQAPAGVGEIGLDRWVKGHDVARQQAVFRWQLRVAAERNRPVSIHCLQAWGDLLEILREGPLPSCGFLLHSYGGSVEMLKPLADLGAYFSFPGYFAHERKTRQRETFRHVPPDRLLVETDAPDQLPPEDRSKRSWAKAILISSPKSMPAPLTRTNSASSAPANPSSAWSKKKPGSTASKPGS